MKYRSTKGAPNLTSPPGGRSVSGESLLWPPSTELVTRSPESVLTAGDYVQLGSFRLKHSHSRLEAFVCFTFSAVEIKVSNDLGKNVCINQSDTDPTSIGTWHFIDCPGANRFRSVGDTGGATLCQGYMESPGIGIDFTSSGATMATLHLQCENFNSTLTAAVVIDITVHFSESHSSTVVQDVCALSEGLSMLVPSSRQKGALVVKWPQNSRVIPLQICTTTLHRFYMYPYTAYQMYESLTIIALPVVCPYAGPTGFVMYVPQSRGSNVVDATVGSTTVIAVFIALENDLGNITSSDEEFVDCIVTQDASNCRHVGGGSELTKTYTVTPETLEDSREITFTGPSGDLATVQVNGEYSCNFIRAC